MKRAAALALILLLAACSPQQDNKQAERAPAPSAQATPPVIAAPPHPGGTPPAARPHAAAPFMPAGAVQYAPLLAAKQTAAWPDVPTPWTLAGLVEQESCVSLKSPRCWNPRAELKTSREYGFGFGQITVAYNADRSERFNKFTELQREYSSLRDWRWADRYDPGYQLTAVIEMTHGIWRRVPPAADADAQWAFTLASYNGGIGALLQDRRLCANSAGCDQTRWFGNVETHSLKSKAPQKAYGNQSWYSINRGYVRNVLTVRRAKYRRFWQ